MQELFDLVIERPDPDLNLNNIKCPYCQSSNVKETGHSQTLVGGDPDPNHHWRQQVCNDCQKEFTLEHKESNFWITEGTRGGKILKGIPSCFENYIYHCKHCGGEVFRKHPGARTFKVGDTEMQMLSTTIGPNGNKNNYRTIFECQSCNQSIETERDHWSPEREKRSSIISSEHRKLKEGWTIVEEIGSPVVYAKYFQKENDKEILNDLIEGLKG